MKKYLLLILTMLSVSIGAWADSGTFGTYNSTWRTDGTVLTLHVNRPNDLASQGAPVTGSWDLSAYTRVVLETEPGITLTGGNPSPLAQFSALYRDIPVADLSAITVTLNETNSGSGVYTLAMADANLNTFKNVIVPAAYSSNPGDLVLSNMYNAGQTATTNNYSISGTTVNAVLNRTDGLTALSNISSDATTLKILNEVGAINLSSVLASGNILDLSSITTASDDSNDITVADGVKVVCLSDGVKSRVKGTDPSNVTVANPVISCAALEVTAKINELTTAGIAPTSITITSGDVDATILAALGIEGLTYLNLANATVTTALNTITLPSTLKGLVLPAAATMDETLKTKVTNSNLDYVYIPTNQTQDEDHQTTADYIWVNKPGGLSNALDNEAKLRSSWYMVVESDVALDNNDVNFWGPGETARVMQYRYLDFSGANVTPAVLYNYRVTDQLAYRIILPNDWTGDDMAVFAANPNCGNIAAVYSYTGTDHKRLDILELHDKAYMPTALNNPRIVRSGTTSIRVVSGHYGSNPVYSKLGKNLLAAINNAASTITSVTIAVGSGIYTLQNEGQENVEDVLVSTPTTFAFTNTNLTNLTMNYINNSYLTVNVSGCTSLQSLYLNETTLAGVIAAGAGDDDNNTATPDKTLPLSTVSLGHAIIGGDVDLSYTDLSTLLEVDKAEITGTLNVSNSTATSFDFTQLTAKKIDASNTNSLTSLDINGVSLNNDTWTTGDSNEDGKVKVTRTGGNYSGLTITTADGFDAERIIPQASSITPAENAYALSSIAPSHVEITAAGSDLSTTVPAAVTAYNNAQDPVESNTVGNVEILHVTGTLTADDITYIKNNLTGLKQLDLSGCTFADGVGVSNIISAAIPTTVAIVLPGKTNTEANTISDVKALQDANYECVAYYTEYNTETVEYYDDYQYIGDELVGVGEKKQRTDRGNSKLNVYGYNGTVGNLYSTEPAIIDGGTIIKFLPRYQNTTVGSASHTFPQSQPSLLTALASVTSANGTRCVDMTWLDISNLGVDFSGIQAYHIIIPQNTQAATTTRNGIVYNNDFTKVDDETTYISTATTKYYKFHHNTQAVSTYKGTASPYATNAYFDGRSMHFDNGYGGLNTTAALVYALKTDGLRFVYDTMSDEQQAADVVMIAGQLDNFSLESGLNNLTNPQIDLTRATLVTDGEDPFTWSDYKNDYVQYLALPDGMNNVIAAKSADDFAFKSYTDGEDNVHGLSALKAVGAYDPTNTKYTVHSTANTVIWTDAPANTTFSEQENSVYVITKLCAPNSSRSAGSALGLTEVEMSGYLTLADIQADGGTTEPGLNCNNNCSITTADFSNAVFMDNEDMTFTGAHWSGNALTSILLPTDERQKRIPAGSLNNYAKLQEICIPYNYEEIGNAAFYLADLRHVTTTDAKGALIDNGENTFTFSKNLREIGDKPSGDGITNGVNNTTGYPVPVDYPVFFSNNLKYLEDVYILRTGYEDEGSFTPTKCYRNAFGAGPTYGWGGFDGGNLYCREKYKNGEQLYTILHFPDLASVGNDQTKYDNVKKTYTDPTKVYTKKDQTGAVDANGESPLWPTHSELGRSYNQATRGLIWDDWNIDTEKQAAGNINGGTITTPPANPSDVTLTKDSNAKHYDFTDYVGWHEFVLSIATYVAPDEKTDENNKIYRSYEKETDWYTFCIPFDMTQDEVIQLLGVPAATEDIVTTLNDLTMDTDGKVTNGESITPVTTALLPEIRTISGVTRNTSTTTVAIRTSADLAEGTQANKYYNPSTGEYVPNNRSSVGGKPITILAGYPYLIKPYKLKGTTIGNLGKQVVTRYEFSLLASAVQHEETRDKITDATNFARPYEGHKVQATADAPNGGLLTHTDQTHNGQPYNYTFIGQFWQQDMPLNCFYQNSKHAWRHYTTYNAAYKWYPYICIIMVTDESTSDDARGGKFRDETNSKYPVLKGTDSEGHDVFDKNLELVYKNGLDDKFGASAREYNFVFDEDIIDLGDGSETTAINRLDGVDVVPADSKVYNMNGQLVGKSLKGLSKGMYIVNGKKIVIR